MNMTESDELEAIRGLCAEAGCTDPGPDASPRTLCIVEELRQRGVCAANHPTDAARLLGEAVLDVVTIDDLRLADGSVPPSLTREAQQRVLRAIARAMVEAHG